MNNRITNFYKSLNEYQRTNSPKSETKFINFMYKDRMLLTPSEDAIKNAKARKRQNNL